MGGSAAALQALCSLDSPVSRGVPAALATTSPSWYLQPAASTGGKLKQHPHHKAGKEGCLRVMASGPTVWSASTECGDEVQSQGPEHSSLMRETLDRSEPDAGSEMEHSYKLYRPVLY